MSDVLNIKRKVIKVSYEGKEYLVAKPSTKQIHDFSEAKDNSIKAMVAFLDMLGLPSAVCWEIDQESVAEIVDALIPKTAQQKKSLS